MILTTEYSRYQYRADASQHCSADAENDSLDVDKTFQLDVVFLDLIYLFLQVNRPLLKTRNLRKYIMFQFNLKDK